MAENKKGFILYTDLLETLKHLPDDSAGRLFKQILEYVNDKHPKPSEDPYVNIAFAPIRCQLKRDLVSYKETREKKSKAGQASAQARAELKEKEEKDREFRKERARVRREQLTKEFEKISPDKKEILTKWLAYRKEINRAINVVSTMKKLVEEFNSKTIEQCKAAVDKSIESKYIGLFWKETKKQDETKIGRQSIETIKKNMTGWD